MSRFLPDCLHIGIEPERVALIRRRSFWSSRIVDEALLLLDATSESGLQQLGNELAHPRWQGSRATIILSDQLVRYFLVMRPEGIRNVQELEFSFALRFEEIFSDTASEWQFFADPRAFASHDLVVACRRSWISTLLSACQLARIKLLSLQTFAVNEWNRHFLKIGRQDGCFVVADRESLWLALRSNSRWISARSHRWQGNFLTALPIILHREQLRSGLSADSLQSIGLSGRHHTHNIGMTHARWLSAPNWPHQTNEWSDQYRLALAPVWPPCI